VTGRILALDRSLEDTLPHVFALLGLSEADDSLVQIDPPMRRRRTHEAIKRLLLRESLNQPLMVIFEDLHWIDGETQALLNLLVDSIGTARMLLLVNYRPEYQHQWGSRTYYTQLRLDPLGREGAEEMLRSLLGDDAELTALKRLIIERTEGNPFFMEETVQVLLDEGALVRNGAVKLIRPLSQLKIPPTVQAILAARIDRLPSAGKDLVADALRDWQGLAVGIGQGRNRQRRGAARADARGPASGRVHIRAAESGWLRVHLQARAHAGGGLQLGTGGAAPRDPRPDDAWDGDALHAAP
jgi:hypothetical protein